MSVNITVNGKFSKESQVRDPEGYKKGLENERRKLRLQQVREQSKELARKIRTDVSQEKERQLRHLEAVKAQELNLWRKTVVAQKSFDFRTALNQVGSAHLAARRERRVEQERAVAREHELLREKERGRIAITKELQSPRKGKPVPRKVAEKPRKQTEKPRKEIEKPKREKSTEKQRQEGLSNEVEQPKETEASPSKKRRERMYVCFDEKFDVKSSCSIDTDSDDQWSTDEIIDTCELLGSSSSSVSGIDTSSQKDTKSTQTETSKETSLKRAPPVLLDVDVDPIKSAVIVAPDHVVDKHVETNRQFDIVVSMDPKKDTAATQTDDIISKNVEVSTLPLDTESAPRPRYTQISDLLAKQKSTEFNATERSRGIVNMEQMSNEKTSSVSTSASYTVDKTAPTSTITSQTTDKLPPATFVSTVTTEKRAPRAPIAATKISVSAPVAPLATQEACVPKASKSLPTTRQATAQRRSVPPYPTRLSQASRFSTISGATTTSSKETGDRSEGAGSFVQFYDYNNKYAKEYNQPIDAVAVPQSKKTEPNAMEQAALENRRLNGREKNIEKLRQKSEERGKAALEREKVRRDCVDLTEKLDALVQKGQPVLPTDANLHGNAYFAEKVARKEAKVNNAIEELLSRPAIITCPDRRNEKSSTSHRGVRGKSSSDLNLGARLCSGESDNAASRSTDTEDSGSILLGYIDDQRDQIRNELTHCDGSPAQNLAKKEKLTQLLGRIETLRESLLRELNNPDKETVPIGDMQIPKQQRQPYEGSFNKKNHKESQALEERERMLKEREVKLQKELAEVIQTQKNLKNAQSGSGSGGATVPLTAVKITAGKEQIIERTTADKPLEIVIKVKGDKKSSKRKVKSTQKNKDNATQEQPAAKSNVTAASNRRGSYDSNSTAYQSIPPTLPAATEQFVERIQKLESNKKQQNSTSTETNRSSSSTTIEQVKVENFKHSKGYLNPLIAQYVQRLLGMSRESVMALEVSSSTDIETPSSSVMNITTNMAGSNSQFSMISEDQLQRVERFVNENRSFINELEESIRSHSNVPLETSLQRFEQIWKQKFKDTSKQQADDPILNVPKAQTVKEKPKKLEQQQQQTTTKAAQPAKQKVEKIQQKKVQVKEVKVTKTSARVVDKKAENEEAEQCYATKTQLDHYAELTKNCSNRIAELTALITKVRQEKQRILEVTLTSVSDNERNSTEYAELPGSQKNGESSSSESTQQQIPELHTSTINTERTKTQEVIKTTTLEKHKQTGRSRDSGISMPSRPVTALGLDTEVEPPSYASSVPTITQSNTQSSSTQRKPRPPPPTLHRYSPQLPEDEVVHELSTIVEVDTPATSRINTSLQPPPAEKQQTTVSHIAFPTFDEYLKELNLNLTIMDPEQSLRMEHEYNELIEALKDGHGDKTYSYEEFPTLITYLKNLTGNEQICQSPETMENLFGCLRLAPLIAKPFPSHKEYLERMPNNSPNSNLIDSESLENLTELQSVRSETESDTLNIEAELKRRNILKQSFRSSSTRYDILSTSTVGKQQQEAQSKQPQSQSTFETGIEKLTTSTTTDSASEKFQRELMALGLKWHKSMRCKEKEAAALSSSTTDSTQSHATHEKFKIPTKHVEKQQKTKNESAAECLSDSESSDQPLNLRDFLTRQLMKHVAATSSCESSLSGESLRSQFFMAVLDSMTPSGSPRTNTASQSLGQRQKTSTPVQTSNTQAYPNNEHSKSNELFSGESNLSFVQIPDQTKRNSTTDKTRKRQ